MRVEAYVRRTMRETRASLCLRFIALLVTTKSTLAGAYRGIGWKEFGGLQRRTVGDMKILLFLAVLLTLSRGASAELWKVVFGGCTFSGNTDGAPLVRKGSCPTENGILELTHKGITSALPDAFQGMSQMT